MQNILHSKGKDEKVFLEHGILGEIVEAYFIPFVTSIMLCFPVWDCLSLLKYIVAEYSYSDFFYSYKKGKISWNQYLGPCSYVCLQCGWTLKLQPNETSDALQFSYIKYNY